MLRHTFRLFPFVLLVGLVAGLVAPRASALPVLSEVFYDATGADNGRTFVELFGIPGTPLQGMHLEGVNGAGGGIGPVVALSGVIPADGLFVIADDRGDGISDVPEADLVIQFDLQNGPDSVVLREGATVLDALGYGDFSGGEVFSGEGSPAPDAPAGSSLARRFADVDTQDNAFDFEVLAVPTPGSAPRGVLSQPAAPSLLLAGLALLGLHRLGSRRHASC